MEGSWKKPRLLTNVAQPRIAWSVFQKGERRHICKTFLLAWLNSVRGFQNDLVLERERDSWCKRLEREIGGPLFGPPC